MRETNALIPVVNNMSDLSLRDLVTPLFRRKRLLLLTFLSV
ncbi:MAG: hypothetical protein QOH96_3776, partial [Blastocatellia bacterium]|nr:hypothetical protein [Blastocatellia bacterium]